MRLRFFQAIKGLALVSVMSFASYAAPMSLPDLGEDSVLDAENVFYDGDLVEAQGAVEFRLGGIRFFCERLSYNTASGWMKAEGDCLFYWDQGFVACDDLEMDLATQKIKMSTVSGQVEQYITKDSVDPLAVFFWGDELLWQDGSLDLTGGGFTTCDRLTADYSAEFERMLYLPDEKVVVHRPSFRLNGRKVLGLPFVSVPLNAKNQFGMMAWGLASNGEDGLGLRRTFLYELGQEHRGRVKLDYYFKTGLGYGLDHQFRGKEDRHRASLTYYRLPNLATTGSRKRYELRSRWRYDIDEKSRLSASYSSSDGMFNNGADGTVIHADLGYHRGDERQEVEAGYNYYRQGDRRIMDYRASYRLHLDPSWDFVQEAHYSKSLIYNVSASRWFTSSALEYEDERWDGDLAFEMMGGSGGGWGYALYRRPELALHSKPIDFWGASWRVGLQAGWLREFPSQRSESRMRLELEMLEKEWQTALGNFGVKGHFRQDLYGNNQAQYQLRSRAHWEKEFNDHWSARVDYFLQEGEGYTPFVGDLQLPYNVAQAGVTYQNKEFFELSLLSAHDFRYGRFHDLVAKGKWQPDHRFKVYSSLRYSPELSSLRTMDAGVSWKLNDKWKLEHWSLWDFQNQRMTYQNFGVHYEDHDWLASVAYRSVQKQLWFQISLKTLGLSAMKIGPSELSPVVPSHPQNAFTRRPDNF